MSRVKEEHYRAFAATELYCCPMSKVNDRMVDFAKTIAEDGRKYPISKWKDEELHFLLERGRKQK